MPDRLYSGPMLSNQCYQTSSKNTTLTSQFLIDQFNKLVQANQLYQTPSNNPTQTNQLKQPNLNKST
jgi:hypothetical protein